MNPLLKNLSIGLGGVVVTVAVYFAAITGGNYQGSILFHLVDKILGSQTTTTVNLNAPNWRLGSPMTPPVITSTATSSNTTAASGLASSTPYYFRVAALDGDGGTTTVSDYSSVTTDASTTQNAPEDIVLKWGAVTGAQGYAIYFSTSTPTNFTQYFLATSTNGAPNTQYTFSTSTGSFAGSDTLTDQTAYVWRLNPSGTSILNGGPVGFSTSTPASSTPADINGYMRAQRNGTSTSCYAATEGVVFFNTANNHEWGCDGTNWNKVF